MPKSTTNYNLMKPLKTESVDVAVLNENFDKIDTAIKINETNILNVCNMIANSYNDKELYSIGDMCIHDYKLYKCIVSIEVAEPFTLEHWAQTNIFNELILAKS